MIARFQGLVDAMYDRAEDELLAAGAGDVLRSR
jgi:hypothetical protein